MYSGGSGLSIDIHFVDIELSYDVLSPLPTLLSKHFNHPHPYIEIATAISDTTARNPTTVPIDTPCNANIPHITVASSTKKLNFTPSTATTIPVLIPIVAPTVAPTTIMNIVKSEGLLGWPALCTVGVSGWSLLLLQDCELVALEETMYHH